MFSLAVVGAILAFAHPSYAQSKLPNIGYIGYGYNVFYGNPHATNAFDPGFSTTPIFEFTYHENRTTPDGRWYLPDDVAVPGSATSCSAQGSSTTIMSAYDYQQSLSIDASFSVGSYGASFSASTDFKMVSQSTGSEKDVFVNTKASCQTYLVSINPFVHPEFSETFAVHAALLPTEFDPNNASMFWKFFDYVGTHFPTQITFGSRWGYSFQSSTQQWATLQQMSLDISVAASYAGEISAGVSLNTSYAQSMAVNFSQNTQSTYEYSLGLPPPSSGSSSSWEAASLTSPEMDPLQYVLQNISVLFSPDYTNNASINAREAAVSAALLQYCPLHLLPAGLLTTCDAPPIPPPPPAPEGHGVLACGTSSNTCWSEWSVVYDGSSDIQAQEVALDSCRGCVIHTTFDGGVCFAMATSSNHYWGWTTGGNLGDIEAQAVTACEGVSKGVACSVVDSGCSTPPPQDVNWGAIACDPGCNNYKATSSVGYPDRIEAHRVAMEEVGGSSASIAIDFYTCGAVAKGDGGWAAAAGATPQDAMNTATAICSTEHSGCQILVYSCVDNPSAAPLHHKYQTKTGGL